MNPWENTYRNSQELAEVTGSFIMANPNQIKKELVSDKHEIKPIRLFCYEPRGKSEALANAIDQIAHDFGKHAKILLLLRNGFDLNFLEDDEDTWQIRKGENGFPTIKYAKIPTLNIYSSTVHSAKGAEEDNVIIVNAENSIHGFPNQMQDDPMLKLVLANPDEFEFAEERRLFYVAMTRTRHRTYILVPLIDASEFARELGKNPNNNLVAIYKNMREVNISRQRCPKCQTGHLVLRRNENTKEYFVGCTNFPQCTKTFNDVSVLKGNVIKCSCGGFMVLRTGKRGNFLGCTNYPTCENTLSIVDT